MSEFETITYQVQFWAEIGQSDGCGLGIMESVDESKPFATKQEAEEWLTEQGWIYCPRVLRRVKPNHGYGLTSVRRYEEANRQKWLKPKDTTQ